MKPVDQTVFTVPGGNCFSACVASLLEVPLEDVPYFMGEAGPNEPSDWFEGFLAWLRPRGFHALCFEHCDAWTPAGHSIMSGKSPRGDFDHCVVAVDGKMVHDPHPSRAGLDGDIKDWVLLVPLDPATAMRGMEAA